MKAYLATLIALLIATPLLSAAAELEYRYKYVNDTYKCVNTQNQEGYNTNYLGECGMVNNLKFDAPSVHAWIAGLQSSRTEYLNADFSASSFVDCTFTKAKLNNPNFDGVSITRSRFNGARMERAYLKGSLIRQSTFEAAEMNRSSFAGALLAQVNFEQANLQNSDFSKSSLSGINFRHANLRDVDFSGAYLADDIIWEGAIYNHRTKLPFTATEADRKGLIRE